MDDIVKEFKESMKKLMDGGVNEDMIKNIETYLKVSATNEYKDFAKKVKSLPFSLKEQYKILYCAIKEQNLIVTKIGSITIQQWKKDNGYGHLDCSHLYKPEDDESTKVIREIIYILHNTSLE